MWRFLAGVKNILFLVVFAILAALLLASAYTHYRGLQAVLARAPAALRKKGAKGKIRVSLKGIRLRHGLAYDYVARHDGAPVLYATYHVGSGAVTTADAP